MAHKGKFSGSALRGLCFDGQNFIGVNFGKVVLKGVSFRGVTLKNVSFHSGFTLSKKYYLNQSSCR
ncbi:pentapeptide repeat-containing protein [Paenibacillus sp. GCM10027630]|uniref:pentapeptide repeat-containing protein n=1 Tax=Paenibacillus sp. GCM10027630 TaxID=3273415 RepID=UPI003645E53E